MHQKRVTRELLLPIALVRCESNRGPIKGKVAQASVVELPRSNQANNDTDIGGNFTRRVAMRWTLCVGLASGLSSLSLWDQVGPKYESRWGAKSEGIAKRVPATRRREGCYRPFNAPDWTCIGKSRGVRARCVLPRYCAGWPYLRLAGSAVKKRTWLDGGGALPAHVRTLVGPALVDKLSLLSSFCSSPLDLLLFTRSSHPTPY